MEAVATHDLHTQLRAWAAGSHPLVAATELLIRAFDGRFAQPSNPWVMRVEHGQSAWIDFENIPAFVGGLSGGERRFLMLAASLADSEVSIQLGELIPGLDRDLLVLVLAAIAHAGGSHEQSGIVDRENGSPRIQMLPSLYPWPEAK